MAAYALILGSVFWTIGYLLLPNGLSRSLSELEDGLLLFGGLSSVAIAMALALWAAKRASGRLAKSDSWRVLEPSRRWARFLHTHHVAFGWAALAAAVAHALYFASGPLDYSVHSLAGWAALAALISLAAVGTLLHRSRGKSGVRRDLRILHGALAAAFVLALSFHAAILAVVPVVWGLLAAPALLVWWAKGRQNNARPGRGRTHRSGPADGERR